MSRRPQEPPRSVSRHHRLASLKTSGIADQLFKPCRCCQKIRGAPGFVPTNQEFTDSPFCAAGASQAFTTKIRKSRELRLIYLRENLLLRSHLSLNRTEDGKRRDNLKSRIAFGDRRRRRPFGPSLSSNSLCACRRPCDLRESGCIAAVSQTCSSLPLRIFVGERLQGACGAKRRICKLMICRHNSARETNLLTTAPRLE